MNLSPISHPYAHLLGLWLGLCCGTAFATPAELSADALVIDPATPLLRITEITPNHPLSTTPDLDLGWQNFLELRCALPPAAANELQSLELRYRCESASSPSVEHRITIPASSLRRDGAMHRYRIDMGLEPGWRGRLVAIELPKHLQWESLQCGDGEGVDDLTSPIDPAWLHRHVMESKHFRLFYGMGLSAKMTHNDAHGTLRNFEECWQVYVKVLKLIPPRPSDEVPGRRRKTNITTHRGGYDTGGGHINIDPSGLRVDPPSWVIAHELMHAFQEVQGGKLAGMWWENHAEYGSERVLRQWRDYFPPESDDGRHGPPTAFNPQFSTMAHWYLGHGRDYYLCWPIWTYLDENPDQLPGLGGHLSSTIWQQHREEENLFSCLQRLSPQLDIAEMLGHYARRNASWAYANGAAMRRVAQDFLRDQPLARRWIETDLLPMESGWFRVPQDRAPQAGGYTLHAITVPTGSQRDIRFELRGLRESPDQDWRVSCVALGTDGTELAHSQPRGPGKNQFFVPDSCARLLLVVCATPKHFENWEQNDLVQPWRDHASRRRFHYALHLENTLPVPIDNRELHRDVAGHFHANGGGFVADTATVAASAYVGSRACVLDQAQVRDRAQVTDNAVIKDQAIVRDEAIVRDNAIVCDHAQVGQSARILQHACLKESAQVTGNATVEGQAEIWSLPPDQSHPVPQPTTAQISGDAIITGDYAGGQRVSNGVQTGFLPYQACLPEWIAARKSPPFQWVNYRFDAPPLALIRDNPGLCDADVLGAPDWLTGETPHQGVLRFSGHQAMQLPASALDLQRGTLAIWVKCTGNNRDQTLFCFANNSRSLQFTPDNGHGQAELSATHGSSSDRIVCRSALPKDKWIHLSVSLDGAQARIFGNGVLAAQGDLPLRWMDFRPARDEIGASHIGRHRDAKLPWFTGEIDDIRIWSRALDAKELNNILTRDPDLLGSFFPTVTRISSASQAIRSQISNGAQGTLCAWIRPSRSEETDLIESVIDSDQPGEFGSGWGLAGGKIRVILDDEFWDTGLAATLGQWQHVALRFNANSADIFVNGTLAASHSYTQGAVTTQKYSIGASAANPLFFHGDLRDARIYQRPLSDVEITAIATQQPPKP